MRLTDVRFARVVIAASRQSRIASHKRAKQAMLRQPAGIRGRLCVTASFCGPILTLRKASCKSSCDESVRNMLWESVALIMCCVNSARSAANSTSFIWKPYCMVLSLIFLSSIGLFASSSNHSSSILMLTVRADIEAFVELKDLSAILFWVLLGSFYMRSVCLGTYFGNCDSTLI